MSLLLVIGPYAHNCRVHFTTISIWELIIEKQNNLNIEISIKRIIHRVRGIVWQCVLFQRAFLKELYWARFLFYDEIIPFILDIDIFFSYYIPRICLHETGLRYAIPVKISYKQVMLSGWAVDTLSYLFILNV